MSPVPGQGGFGRGGGRGMGMGGGGRGRRNWFHATGLPGWQRAGMGQPAWGTPQPQQGPVGSASAPMALREEELQALRSQADGMEAALQGIRKRIDELAAQAPDEG